MAVPKAKIIGVSDLSVVARKIAPGAVITSKILDLAVTEPKLADGAVTSRVLASSAIAEASTNEIWYSPVNGLTQGADKAIEHTWVATHPTKQLKLTALYILIKVIPIAGDYTLTAINSNTGNTMIDSPPYDLKTLVAGVPKLIPLTGTAADLLLPLASKATLTFTSNDSGFDGEGIFLIGRWEPE